MRFHLARLLAFLALLLVLALVSGALQHGPGGPGWHYLVLVVIALVPAVIALIRAGGAVLHPEGNDTWQRLGWALAFFLVSAAITAVAVAIDT